MGYYIDDRNVFNPLLTEWLIKYNFYRPHQSLGYSTPMNVLYENLEIECYQDTQLIRRIDTDIKIP